MAEEKEAKSPDAKSSNTIKNPAMADTMFQATPTNLPRGGEGFFTWIPPIDTIGTIAVTVKAPAGKGKAKKSVRRR